jgi:hypothetical protein
MPQFKQPADYLKTESDQERRVGFELEFSALDVATTAECVARAVSGAPFAKTPAHWQVDAPLGSFQVEIDWDFLQRIANERGEQANKEAWLDSLSSAAAKVVPVEVVCPPIAITELTILNDVVAALRDAGAQGTRESPIAAYGTHINPELPDLKTATIQRYMQAYAVLQWWLVEQHHVNTTRKLSPYIDLYSESYVVQLLSYENPSISTIIDDYLAANPSRNRALDMLPLFCELDPDRVSNVINDSKLKSRPTLHYRLPDCRIDDAQWTLASEWNIYFVVEQLAHRPKALDELTSAFLAAQRPMLGVSRNHWLEYVSKWLNENLA